MSSVVKQAKLFGDSYLEAGDGAKLGGDWFAVWEAPDDDGPECVTLL